MAQHSEILIIGGGVIGLSIARELRKAGVHDIAILERGTLGCEASSAAAGILAPQAEADSVDVFFEFCRESLGLYPSLAAELLEETGIDIELDKTGTLYLALTGDDRDELETRYRWQRDGGLEVEYIDSKDIAKIEPNVAANAQMGLRFPNDWQVENRRLLTALGKFAEVNDLSVQEHANVDTLIVEDGKVAGAVSGSRRYLANTTILTTGAWTSLIKLGVESPPFTVAPVRGQMICYRPDRPLVRSVIYSPRGYIVPRADGRILVGATVEHAGFDKNVTDEGVESLRTVGAEILPELSRLPVVESWAGLRPFVSDGLPVIGSLSGLENICVATGHYRNGILLAPLTAKVIAAKVVSGSGSRYLDVFGAKRFEESANATHR